MYLHNNEIITLEMYIKYLLAKHKATHLTGEKLDTLVGKIIHDLQTKSKSHQVSKLVFEKQDSLLATHEVLPDGSKSYENGGPYLHAVAEWHTGSQVFRKTNQGEQELNNRSRSARRRAQSIVTTVDHQGVLHAPGCAKMSKDLNEQTPLCTCVDYSTYTGHRI